VNSIEYFTNKNKIIHEVTGFDLVPNNQLIDIPITKKMVEDMEKYVNSTTIYTKNNVVYLTYPHHKYIIHLTNDNCLYCAVYRSYNCEGCLMNDSGNNCLQKASTYQRTIMLLRTLNDDKKRYIQSQLHKLAKKFVKANKGKL